jgi:uncharacterized protein (DUF2126 family)
LSIHVALNHVTRYRYDRRVGLGPQLVRLRPAPHCRTKVLSYALRVEPELHFINWQQDPFANYLARLVFPDKTTEFQVTVDLVAEMAVYNPFDFFLEPGAESFPFGYEASLRHDLQPYLACDALTPRLRDFIASVDRSDRRTIDFLVELNQRLQHEIRYLIRLEPGVQTPEQTLTLAAGSCRDTGWLLVQVLRHLGLAARFVSGYLIQLKPDVQALDGPSGAERDFTDLHAWCEVYLPGAGWIGLDPTSGLLAGEGHLPVACTPEPTTAAPISGVVDECDVEFGHAMQVTRIYEAPRVTKPYTDEQWRALDALGQRVDADLVAMDVRLTQGGEPTFVSIDDRDGAEWNTAALGPGKRRLAIDLLLRLKERYGGGGFLHLGQGKWYPGEQLPRWALSIFWRTDGEPCWRDAALFADERAASSCTTADAERFIRRLAQRLGIDGGFVVPGYEDALYYLWRERKLPVNVDPFDARLADELERARLLRVFEQGLPSPVGYTLPIRRREAAPGRPPDWVSSAWFLRGERMVLVPGDSPMGYRLPLDSLPWVAPEERPPVLEPDPFAPRGALPLHADIRSQVDPHAVGGGFAEGGTVALQAGFEPDRFATWAAVRPLASSVSNVDALAGGHTGGSAPPRRFESSATLTRTALCVEVRDPRRASGPAAERTGSASQVLYVFMPPLTVLEDYLALVATVEATAAELGLPVVLEGYPPPRDARLRMLQVTPDPGVIEVNIHPAANWRQLVDHTETLYEAARLSRLATEKFMLDGRHTGTGGGNHIVLGGATAEDSPFLRRPDLLASLISYWHNHPSLSYLFSGLFIGPTSQAPRVDEARNDQVYELEIALAELRERSRGQSAPPWLVDRALRNILIDVTGNTHRSEFCIDKMYSPDGPNGRLGLLEMRAFEMPPHWQMSLAQQLLLRALLARFWRTPYSARLARWGTDLHDRFLLPTFLALDFDDVLAELAMAGYELKADWFAPHFEFRFPLYGHLDAMGVRLTIRAALEPWHVMGEEGAAGGTVRYVDSSLERIEVRASGITGARHVVTVNGRALPLQPTGRAGEQVCGVRYRAWQPASALHPTIGVHAPLTFDLVDTWMERSLGGCQYHVAHPGGRNYVTFPVNAYEAESRRLARFSTTGHTPGRMLVAEPRRSPEFPFTLDLRQR